MSSFSVKAQIPPDELANLLNQPLEHFSKGNYEESIKLYKQLYNRTKDTDLAIVGAHCAYEIAQIYSIAYNDLNSCMYWLERAYEYGIHQAAGVLGSIYLTGQDGVPQDSEKAKYYFEKCNEGESLWTIATMYSPYGEFGRNDSEWLKYASKAAEKGYADAQFYLGLWYLEGKVVSKDLGKGIELIKKAAQQNFIRAIRFLEEQNIQ